MNWNNRLLHINKKNKVNFNIIVGLVSILVALAIFTILKLASGLFIPLIIAWFMLQIFSPVLRIGKKMGLPDKLNVILVFAVLFSLFVIGIHFSTTQVIEFNKAFNLYYVKINEMINDVLKVLQIPPEYVEKFSWMDIISRQLRNISELIYTLASKIVLTLVFLMFMLMEAPFLEGKIDKAFSGRYAKKIKRIKNSVSTQISRYLATLTLISMATGAVVWLALQLLGVELAATWGVLTFLLNYIPTVGSIIATIPPVVMALLQFSPSYIKPLTVLLMLGAVQITIGNVITPKVVGDRLDLSPVIILMSLLLWGMIWGIPGALLSVPITSIIKIVCDSFPTLKPIAVMMGSGVKRNESAMPPEIPEATTQQPDGQSNNNK